MTTANSEPLHAFIRRVNGDPAEQPFIATCVEKLNAECVDAQAKANVLADALDRFFYDLRFTAPEAVGMRLNQLGERITPTMTELGYPKRGVTPPAESESEAK